MQRFFHDENYKFVLKFASSPALKLQKRNEVSVSKSKVVNERLLQQKFSPFLRIALKIFFSIYYLIMKAKRSLFLHTIILLLSLLPKNGKKGRTILRKPFGKHSHYCLENCSGILALFCKIKNGCSFWQMFEAKKFQFCRSTCPFLLPLYKVKLKSFRYDLSCTFLLRQSCVGIK